MADHFDDRGGESDAPKLTALFIVIALDFQLAIDDEAKALEIIELVQREFPRLKILARATSRQHAYEILRLGVTQVYRETLGSALDLSVDALRELGMDERRARRVAEIFREHDEASVPRHGAPGEG